MRPTTKVGFCFTRKNDCNHEYSFSMVTFRATLELLTKFKRYEFVFI